MALTGVTSALIGALMVRYLYLGNQVEEAKRYEHWGRKVEQVFERYPQKKKQLYEWVGGGP